MKKILVVDDEKRIVEIIKAYLNKEGYNVMTAYDGEEALNAAATYKPDLIVLDLMLPKVSGWDVCRELRKTSDVPIIMVTARDEVTDKIIGLELGADDYVSKPFDPKEIVSRVRAILRRMENTRTKREKIDIGGLSIDIEKRQVSRDGQTIELTAIEFQLLTVMAETPGIVYSRSQLLDKTQGDAYEGYERTIDSHIKNLRKKIEPDADHPEYVITVRGVGYKVEDKPDA